MLRYLGWHVGSWSYDPPNSGGQGDLRGWLICQPFSEPEARGEKQGDKLHSKDRGCRRSSDLFTNCSTRYEAQDSATLLVGGVPHHHMPRADESNCILVYPPGCLKVVVKDGLSFVQRQRCEVFDPKKNNFWRLYVRVFKGMFKVGFTGQPSSIRQVEGYV